MSKLRPGASRLLLGCLATIALAPVTAHAQTHLLIVSGLGGEPRWEQEFARWGATMYDAAVNRYGMSRDQIVYLADKPEQDPERISARSTKPELERALRELAQRAGPSDRILILLMGHGSSDSQGARVNLPGPDMTAAELAALLDLFATQRVVVVNTASASGDYQQPLAGRNRAIITATRSGMQRNETMFGGFFVDAFAGEGADTDKDGVVSVLEAFEFAKNEVERHYQVGNRLQTEHSVLGGDLEIARSFALAAGRAAPLAASGELRALMEQRQEIEARVGALRARRAEMQGDEYEAQLEDLLIELALKNREIRALEGGQ
jgi:hypothetical protein